MPFTNGGFCSPPAHTSFPSYRALSPTPPDTALTSFAGNLDLAMVLTRRGRSTGGGDKPARPARKEKVPEKQTPAVLALCAVGIPLAFAAFLLGCGGVAVLMGAPSCYGRPCLPLRPCHDLPACTWTAVGPSTCCTGAAADAS